jgi:beta-N-acetylhexosaminidase
VDIDKLVGQKLLFAFHGKEEPSPEIIAAFKKFRPSGITLFRSMNVGTLPQLKALTSSLQDLARSLDMPPLLIAADQEGGQLMAVGDGTPLPGNMALGASGSAELAHKAGEVLGRELSALGINVNYAPCVDVNINPHNPVVGTRSFGEDPHWVAELAAAMIGGIQSQGVAAAAKHFPGHGDTASDSHHEFATVPHSLDRLHAVELPPFVSAVKAGVRLVMTAHLGIPSIDGPDAPPATLSPNIISGLLRRSLGFDGVVVTDAMDMHAIRQGKFLGEDALRAANAGADLLLITSSSQDQERVFEALVRAIPTDQLMMQELVASSVRIARLKTWLSGHTAHPDLSVVCSAGHVQVAGEIAERSITLVRDDQKTLPLSLPAGLRIAVVIPVPQDLTPADTSSYVQPRLGDYIREIHEQTREFQVPYAPDEQDIASLLDQIRGFDVIIAGTINAFIEGKQAEMVRQLLKMGKPVVVVAVRLPYDLAAFPQATTFVCTYSILEPSLRALARALFGIREMKGRLPVSIPGLYTAGHSLTTG